jgi:beta-lactamase class A
MHLLAQVDEGRRRLDEELEILPRDVTRWVSPIAQRWPQQTRWPLREMLRLMVAQSDNTAVDALYRIGGGPSAATARLRAWGISGMRLDRPERLCALHAAGIQNIPPEGEITGEVLDRLLARATPASRRRGMEAFLADPRDTASPNSTVLLLAKAQRGELLSAASTGFLFRILEETATGPRRLKGMLPPGTVVAHKTGTTGTAGKRNGGTNDVGVIRLPGGAGNLAIAVYVKGSTAPEAARERVIAQIARAAYDAALEARRPA